MTYSERKTQEILSKVNLIGRRDKIEQIIKEIIRDVRHQAAENVLQLKENVEVVNYKVAIERAHNTIINTKMD